ncbi:hypothetical protein DFO77_1153 [Marinilabilia salmonicolor]|uniref:Uncharacterized protein n=1 Tax=Marinilabilia salmonicolor TaxID=989 RepID=A0A368UUD6_9BACT|nr:hypothetical protein DFO77_1153 [Marinilabilia salmonicolor]
MLTCFNISRVTNTVNDVSKLMGIVDFDEHCFRSNLLRNIVYSGMNICRVMGE